MVLRPPCVLGGAAARGGLIVKVTGNSLKHGNRVSLKKKKKQSTHQKVTPCNSETRQRGGQGTGERVAACC